MKETAPKKSESKKLDDESPPVEGEIRIESGNNFIYRNTGYTVKEFFSQDGPGWIRHANELKARGLLIISELPDDPYMIWEVLDD